jgi:carboxylesterase type B
MATGAAAASSSSSIATPPQGEDCLTLDIQRPANVIRHKSLPVLFWIFGGGLEVGSTQTYDATLLIQKSVTLHQDIIYVEVNYRLNSFSFLSGKEVQQEGSTNMGLRDQHLALEWVAENIEGIVILKEIHGNI